MSRTRILSSALSAVVAAALAVAAPGFSQEPSADPRVSVTLSTDKARVGDLVDVRLLVEIPASAATKLEFPNWQKHWGAAEIRSVSVIDEQTVQGSTRYSQTVTVTSFRPGEVILPPATMTISEGASRTEIEVKPSPFQIVSVLPADAENLKPKPPTAPELLPVGREFLWTATGLAILALALLGILFVRSRGTVGGDLRSVRDPWAAFEQAVARLADERDAERVFTILSLELRRYLGRSLKFPAAESTTSQLRRRLAGKNLPISMTSALVKLLAEADGIKFARENPGSDRAHACLDEVHRVAKSVHLHTSAPPAETESSASEAAA